jgi:hypothetical protein
MPKTKKRKSAKEKAQRQRKHIIKCKIFRQYQTRFEHFFALIKTNKLSNKLALFPQTNPTLKKYEFN